MSSTFAAWRRCLFSGFFAQLFAVEPPGLAALSPLERTRLQWQALRLFLGSGVWWRLWVCLALWLFAGLQLVWHLDRPAHEQVLPLVTAWLWLWPWAVYTRRRLVAKLLPGAGGDDPVCS